MAQDAQLGVCAHMTLWTSTYFHHLAYGHRRSLPVDVADAVPAVLGDGRPAPSTGLKVSQIAAGSLHLGLPALVYGCDDLPDGESIPRVVCRYLNSGMPVIVAAGGRHAFVLVGYRRDYPGTADERLRFIAQDDERGPYQLIEDFHHDRYGAWDHLIVPLPQKVFVPGEIAEKLGEVRIRTALHDRQANDAAAATLLRAIDRHPSKPTSVTFRSTVMRSNQFKTTLRTRGASSEVATLYRRMQMPRWIWVVEATQRRRRNAGTACVVAEVVIDATDHSRDMRFLAMRIPGQLWNWLPDEDRAAHRSIDREPIYESVSRFILKPPLAFAPR